MTLHGNRDFADVINFGLFSWGVYLGLSTWTQCNHRVLIEGRQEDQTQREKDNMMKEAAKG